ncbi:hypothetical protein NPIL_571871 [Nephila pilipes]|uniref:Uncharacterized protein n=1 Tax=Nephila pilipes TaxID=299642 RepID=A0A8X6NM19_NEPPI|nr:hypothetical protein NPIL_571871 [Nephila pilipes]
MAERETGNALDCDKIFVKRTLQREKHILSSLLTEVFVSLDEIEKILLETDPWEKMRKFGIVYNWKGNISQELLIGSEKWYYPA